MNNTFPDSWLKWEGRGGLKNALRIKRDTDLIGEILQEFLGYEQGGFVIAQPGYALTWIVEMPMSEDMIKNEISRGSLLTTLLTIMGVPKTYVRIIYE